MFIIGMFLLFHRHDDAIKAYEDIKDKNENETEQTSDPDFPQEVCTLYVNCNYLLITRKLANVWASQLSLVEYLERTVVASYLFSDKANICSIYEIIIMYILHIKDLINSIKLGVIDILISFFCVISMRTGRPKSG